MRIYAGVTDQDWFDYLRSQPQIDEVNFWQPSGSSEFRALRQGDLFLFKLHRNKQTRARTDGPDLIAGSGVFASFSALPISWAWETFDIGNGAPSYPELRRQVLRHRPISDDSREDFQVGCVVLTQPLFFDEALWFPVPDWSASIVRGKGYNLETQAGKYLWDRVQHAWRMKPAFDLHLEARRIEEDRARYGKEITIHPRLGQRTFRVLVADAYQRACAITEEHSLPALEAAHIKPYNESGPHAVNNGLLLRSDLHRLFDRGYITITPEYRIEVSRRLKDDFKNGRSYYPFHGQSLSNIPVSPIDRPLKDKLIWHNESVFRG